MGGGGGGHCNSRSLLIGGTHAQNDPCHGITKTSKCKFGCAACGFIRASVYMCMLRICRDIMGRWFFVFQSGVVNKEHLATTASINIWLHHWWERKKIYLSCISVCAVCDLSCISVCAVCECVYAFIYMHMCTYGGYCMWRQDYVVEDFALFCFVFHAVLLMKCSLVDLESS